METTQFTSTRHGGLLDRKYWEFFVPTIMMAMTLTMSVVIDSIIVGNMLGPDALAAVNLVMPVIMAYNTVAVCLGLGAATIISVAKGRRQPDYADTMFTTSFATMAGLGILLLAVQIFSIDAIAGILTQEPTLRPLVRSFLQVLVYGTPLIIAVPGLAYCLRVDGRVKLASAVLIVTNLVNLALDLVYMGPLKMGIAGSSLATVSGYVVGAVMLLFYAFSKHRTLHFIPGALGKLSEFSRHVREIIKTGTPAAMGSILITVKILCVNHIVLAVAGKNGMVAFSVCLSCLSFVSMFISGAAQAMTPIVGVLYGETDYSGVRIIVLRAFKTLMIASITATLLLETAPSLVLKLFGVHDGAIIAEGVTAIRIFSISLTGTSISFLAMFFFMTTSRTKLSTAISIVQGISVVPIAFVLAKLAGVKGVWVAFTLTEIVTILMIVTCYARLKRSEPAKYKDILLLDQQQLSQNPTLETTSGSNATDIEETSRRIGPFLDSLQLKPNVTETLRASITESVSTIAKTVYAAKKRNFIDIRLDADKDALTVSLRDGGKEFNLADNGFEGADDLKHSRAIGFNNHTLTYHLA